MIGKSIKPEDSIVNFKPDGNPAIQKAKPENRTTVFVAREPVYCLENIILSEPVKTQLRTLKARLANHRLLYEDWGLAAVDPQGKHTAFNLYGPPGTGKTMCVEALAKEWRHRIIDVSYAEIESKYVGDTGKNIVAAFNAAREQNAVLFFDEADSILGHRMTSVTQAADHGVNVARAVMLKQLDAFDGIVAFATNLVRNFDTAFTRRIALHIEIPLPDHECRVQLWRKIIPDKVPFKNVVDWEALALNSEEFSGGDIKNAVINSLARLAESGEWENIHVMQTILQEIEHLKKAKDVVGNSGRKIVKDDVVEFKPEDFNKKEDNHA